MADRSSLVIIPTYNEAKNVSSLLKHILSLPSLFHLLIIDDASPDGTSAIVKSMQQTDPEGARIHIIDRPGKLGLGTAYKEGFSWALQRNYSYICEMDADFSHDPGDLEQLLEKAKEADLVLGARYIAGGGTVGWPFHRRFLSRSACILAKWATGLPLSDLTGGFKCYRREALEKLDLKQIQSSGYSFQIETTFRVAQAGGRVAEVPIIFRERERGVSKIASFYTIWQTLWLLLRIVMERFS